jgi:hypothetical protein
LNRNRRLYSLSINKINGIYNLGADFDQTSLTLLVIVLTCRVYVKKIDSEMRTHGRVLHPEEKKLKRNIGPGANSLDTLDSFILLVLNLTATLPD